MLHQIIIFLYKYEFGFVWNSQGVGDQCFEIKIDRLFSLRLAE